MEPTYAGLPCIHLSRNGIALLSEKLGHVSNGPESPLKLPQSIVKQLTLKSQVRGLSLCVPCVKLYAAGYGHMYVRTRTHALAHSNTCTNTHMQTYTQNAVHHADTHNYMHVCIHNTQIHVYHKALSSNQQMCTHVHTYTCAYMLCSFHSTFNQLFG